jgi:putative transposase
MSPCQHDLPISLDLRLRIVHAVERGSSIRDAARRFAVSHSAAIKLMQRVRATGSAAPTRYGGHRRRVFEPTRTAPAVDDFLPRRFFSEFPWIIMRGPKARRPSRGRDPSETVSTGHLRRFLRTWRQFLSRAGPPSEFSAISIGRREEPWVAIRPFL